MFEEDFRALLLGGIGGLIDGRVHWTLRPQGGALPALVLNAVSEVVTYTMQGQVDLVQTRVQMDAYGATAADVLSVDRAVAALVSGYAGIQGATEFQGIFLESRQNLTEPATGSTAQVHRISRDVFVHHRPAS